MTDVRVPKECHVTFENPGKKKRTGPGPNARRAPFRYPTRNGSFTLKTMSGKRTDGICFTILL